MFQDLTLPPPDLAVTLEVEKQKMPVLPVDSGKLLFPIIFGCLVGSCSLRHVERERFRLYQLHHMEALSQDYFANDLKRIAPGLACGDFKNTNEVGCFKLIVDTKQGKAVRLIYHELTSDLVKVVYQFNPPVDNVYIEKINEVRLRSSQALPGGDEVVLEPGQPSVQLVFIEKSAVVFYWKDGAFHEIWTSD